MKTVNQLRLERFWLKVARKNGQQLSLEEIRERVRSFEVIMQDVNKVKRPR